MRWEDLRSTWEGDNDFRAAYRDEYPYHAVADAIVALRKERGLTQSDLAVVADTSQSVIARVESGKHAVRIDLLNRIADGLGLIWNPRFEAAPASQMIIRESQAVVTVHAEFRIEAPASYHRSIQASAVALDRRAILVGRSVDEEQLPGPRMRLFLNTAPKPTNSPVVPRPTLALAS